MTEIELQIYISKEGKLLLTPERVKLLRTLELTGSLLMAAKTAGISYNKAWNMIEQLNQILSRPLVIKSRGGKGGGGAFITDYGRFILGEFTQIEKQVMLFKDNLNTEINI